MPRHIAADVLEDILIRKKPFDQSFAGHPKLEGLTPRDRNFAYQLVMTTLRRLGQIDALLAQCLERPLPQKGAQARTILRLGICQICFLETAPHAAVDTSVDLAQSRNQGPYKKLINAVLRRIVREGVEKIGLQDGARLNTPDWLWQSWSDAYGETVCREIAKTHLDQPPLDITVKDDPHHWAKELGGQVLSTGTIRLAGGGATRDLPGFDEGAWWVQDAGAALPVILLGDIKDKSVADLCAAPGGKTAQLAALGARVTAVDRSAARLATLRHNLSRLNLSVDTVEADATKWRPTDQFDAVLVDAPCTATGTIRRHPDIMRLKTAKDVAGVAAIQSKLLNAASELVMPGGLLVFVTCSLQPEEGPSVIEAFLKSGAPFERLPIVASEVGGWAEAITESGDLRTLPSQLSEWGGMDGFFAARLASPGATSAISRLTRMTTMTCD